MEPEVCTGESGFGALHQSDDFICSRRRNQAIIDVGISLDELLDVSLLAVLYRFPQSVSCHSPFPNRWTVIWNFAIGFERLFSSNDKKRRMRCSGETWNERKICSTHHTPQPRLRVRSGQVLRVECSSDLVQRVVHG